MLAKLVAVVLALGLCGGSLVVIRDLRVRADQELARAHLKNVQLDSRLWQARAEIARRLTPRHIRLMAEPLGPLEPISAPEQDGGALYLVRPGGTGGG